MHSNVKITKTPIKGFGNFIRLKSDKFTQKDLYDFIGRNDYYVNLQFHDKSISDLKFGSSLSGKFLFTREEREYLNDKPLIKGLSAYQPFSVDEDNIPKELSSDLNQNGIHIFDIKEIQYIPFNVHSSYHDENTDKKIDKIEINASSLKKHNIFKIERNFLVQRINNNEKIIPEEKYKLVGYLLAENNNEIKHKILDLLNLSVQDVENNIRVSYYLYKYKLSFKPRDEKLIKTLQHFAELLETDKIKIAIKEIVKLKISNNETDKFINFLKQLKTFSPNVLKFTGGVPIWWDEQTFTHFCLRHTKEYQLNHYKQKVKYPKTTYSYKFDDIEDLINKVLDFYTDDICNNFSNEFPKPFYRNGKKAVLYNGDCYGFQIEKDGRISQFFQYHKELT